MWLHNLSGEERSQLVDSLALNYFFPSEISFTSTIGRTDFNFKDEKVQFDQLAPWYQIWMARRRILKFALMIALLLETPKESLLDKIEDVVIQIDKKRNAYFKKNFKSFLEFKRDHLVEANFLRTGKLN